MTQRTTTHRLAGTAIAAVPALSTTPVWAQDVAPLADAPVAAPVAQPAPTIVLPPVAASPVAPAPVAEQAPDQAVSAPRIAAKASEPRATVARSAVPVSRPAPVRAAAAAPASEPAPGAPVAAIEPLPADIAAPPVATAGPASPSDSNDLGLAGLAGALGLGALGLFAATRRRRRRVEPRHAATGYEPVDRPAKPVGHVPLSRGAQPIAAARPVEAQRFAAPTAAISSQTTAWSEPRVQRTGPLDNRALDLNRAALIDRMVAAEPDANNPFTSAKARRRRARIMLQSMDNDRWENAELSPGFDWREMAQAVERKETVDA